MKEKSEFKVLLVYPNLVGMLVPPLSIAIFTRIFKDQGYQVELFDATPYVTAETSSPEKRVKYLQARKFSYVEDLGVVPKFDLCEDFAAKVENFTPDFIVVSCVEDTFLQAVKLLESVKEMKIPSLVGGVFVTAAPSVAIAFPVIHMIGLQEGEKTVLEVAERIRQGLAVDDVPNTWIKKKNGEIVKNKIGTLIDVNRPHPDFSLFDASRFNRPMGGRIFRTIPMETYRGCPYQCTFCNSPMQVSFSRENTLGNFLRRKRIEFLRDEIKYLMDKYEPEFFYIIDDSFLARPDEEINDFCDMYQEFKVPFWFNTRPENCSAERLDRLQEVGCYRISFGLEHGNEEFRKKVLLRYPSNEELLKRFEIIRSSGIAFSVNNIIGFPDETRELVFETIELNRQLQGYDTLTVSIFTPYHGTALRDVCVAKGYLHKEAFTTHTTSSSMLNMPTLSVQEIDALARTFTLYVEFPKSLWPLIRVAEKFTEEGEQTFRKLSQMYNDHYLGQDQFSRRQTDWENVFGHMSKVQAR